MSRPGTRTWVTAGVVAVALAIGFLAGQAYRSEPEPKSLADQPTPSAPSTPGVTKGSEASPTEPSPASASPETSSPAQGSDQKSPIRLSNLTTGFLWKEAPTTSITSEPVVIPADSLVLVHLMSCCDHESVPRVSGPSSDFELAVTHETGEKRHWVLRAANDGPTTRGTLTFTFDAPQSRVLWVVDAATNVELGDNGADAIVQSEWQDSQPNAPAGQIDLQPFEDGRNVGVAFAIAGSGTATDIAPRHGATETAEAEVGGSALIMNTFWSDASTGSLAAEFLDDGGQPAVESWLFLALELRAR
jgi:hypothetical protein